MAMFTGLLRMNCGCGAQRAEYFFGQVDYQSIREHSPHECRGNRPGDPAAPAASPAEIGLAEALMAELESWRGLAVVLVVVTIVYGAGKVPTIVAAVRRNVSTKRRWW